MQVNNRDAMCSRDLSKTYGFAEARETAAVDQLGAVLSGPDQGSHQSADIPFTRLHCTKPIKEDQKEKS